MDEMVGVVGTTTIDDNAGNEGEKVLRMRKDDGEADDGKTLTVTRESCWSVCNSSRALPELFCI